MLAGKSQRGVADELNRLGVPTPRGCQWCPTKIQRVLARSRESLERRLTNGIARIANPEEVRRDSWAFEAAPIVWRLRLDGVSLRKIALELQRLDVPTARGGPWHHLKVKTALKLTPNVFPPVELSMAA
jgi:hypothetical protein